MSLCGHVNVQLGIACTKEQHDETSQHEAPCVTCSQGQVHRWSNPTERGLLTKTGRAIQDSHG